MSKRNKISTLNVSPPHLPAGLDTTYYVVVLDTPSATGGCFRRETQEREQRASEAQRASPHVGEDARQKEAGVDCGFADSPPSRASR